MHLAAPMRRGRPSGGAPAHRGATVEPMGEPVHVAAHATAVPGVLRFETDRPLTGSGHRGYASLHDVRDTGDTADLVASRLFEDGLVDYVHVYSNVITVELARGASPDGLLAVLRRLFVHYDANDPVAAELVDAGISEPAVAPRSGATADPDATVAVAQRSVVQDAPEEAPVEPGPSET